MEKINLLKGKKILVVDDEPDVLESLEELLPMCLVIPASTFEEARELLESKDFDMAILDIMGVDGYKLLEIAGKKKVTAVMLTAHALSVEDTVKSYKKGAAYYVPKERMGEIATYLTDVLKAEAEGKPFWARWLDRMDAYYVRKFGPDWKDDDRKFWERFSFYT